MVLSTFVTALKNRNQDITKAILKGILVSGIFVAILVMSTTTVQISQYLCDAQEVEHPTDDNNAAKDQESLKAFEAITTSAQITLEHEFSLIHILPELINEEKEYFSSENLTTIGGKASKILFRQIISPNAP